MIIASLLDLDFYKLTMAQLVWRRFADWPVAYGLTNRTKKVRLAEIVAERDLRKELDKVRRLRFTRQELDWLRESQYLRRGLFCDGFLDFLRDLRLPPYDLKVVDGQFALSVKGRWREAIFWETLMLSVVNELYNRELFRRENISSRMIALDGEVRLRRKLQDLRRETPDVRFIEFGTRRRYSREWQAEVLRLIIQHGPEMLIGTSNVDLARRFGLKPIGTFAHELYMVTAAAAAADDEALRRSHNLVIQDWWQEYGEPLSIALTDTFGTEFFFHDFTPEQARDWRGLRQDSGDPFAFGERAVGFYQALGIDPRTKTVVFSDGLDPQTIIDLQRRFAGRLQVVFGWGTNLTNDCGYPPLSLVVKATEACGRPTVKLSDNLAKAMGPPDEVERYKRVFGYGGGIDSECVY
jgi:nicotinate phosphoribosyltransferase